MNREQRRKMEKALNSRGVTQEAISLYLDILKRADKVPEIQNGSSVKINTEQIKTRKDYGNLSEKYRSFIESNQDRVFTTRMEQSGFVSLLEQPEWLFWSGDLIVI